MSNSVIAAPAATSLPDLLGENAGTIGAALRARARRSPDSPFLLWGEQTWTYAQTLELVEKIARNLDALCRSGRPRVATYLENCPEALWTWLGCALAGRVCVPINRKHRGELLADMLRRCSAGVLITDNEALSNVLPLLGADFHALIVVDTVPVDVPSALHFEALLHMSERTLAASPAPSDTACVLFTSGTTGRSKGVLVRHNQYVRGAARLVDGYGLRATDVFHNWLPLCHLAGQLHMTMTAILCGGAVALLPTFSASKFREEVTRHGCSVLCGFAAVLHFIWSLPARADDANLPLRVGIFAAIPVELHRKFEQRFGMALGENYGMTEIDPVTCPTPGVATPLGSCGLPCPDVDLAILNEHGMAQPPGMTGRIAIRARAPDILMGGYDGDQAATQAVMHGDWFITSDFGELDAHGFLHYRGRASHFIRRRGENVSVVELEGVMTRHPAIAECAAVAVPSEVGEDEIKLAVSLRDGTQTTPAELHEYATQCLARFMVPRFIEIYASLPRGELGKVAVGELRRNTSATWDADKRPPSAVGDTR